jgi:hypothetical protein
MMIFRPVEQVRLCRGNWRRSERGLYSLARGDCGSGREGGDAEYYPHERSQHCEDVV